ncbi:hypothetical protein QNI19_19780 [Cytophagaceae bacterium DM2B3-1]|uniref:Glycosyltransferase RgtA/B/C/D-like domain-containing protein n=1 Tax=Xanthocytophaga flava TaxID=3048013 RepID=A0ABT7CND5_9BACT|nr:hypothetical protein [Xanthocytophaga flavus]MDJ1495190.1 hypothetical protein [Xanthocytophaga flavus]
MNFKLIVLLCLLVSAGMYGYSTWCGLGITYDSQHYLSAASSLLQDGVLKNADGSIYSNWPPLYPVFLALFGTNEFLIKIGQGIVLLGIVYLTYCIVSQCITDKVLRAFLLIGIAVGTPLMLVNVFVWSEGLFVLLTLAMYLLFQKYQQSPKWPLLIGLIIVSNLLCLQRLVGIGVVGLFGIMLYLNQRDVKKAGCYIALSWIGVLIWLWRNIQVEVNPSFVDNVFVASLNKTLYSYIEAIGNWIVPVSLYFSIKVILVIGWLISTGLFLFYKRISVKSFAFQANFLGWSYLFFMIGIGGTLTEIDRFAVPGYIWLIAGFIAIIDTILPQLSRKSRWILYVMIVVWLLYPTGRTLKNVVFWHDVNCGKQIIPN